MGKDKIKERRREKCACVLERPRGQQTETKREREVANVVYISDNIQSIF